MSADRSYTEEVKRFSQIVENFAKELNEFKTDIKNSLNDLSSEVKGLKRDADNLTEGNRRHGIEPVRQVAKEAKDEADRANLRIDKIIWICIGASAGSGVGASVIFNLLQSFV